MTRTERASQNGRPLDVGKMRFRKQSTRTCKRLRSAATTNRLRGTPSLSHFVSVLLFSCPCKRVLLIQHHLGQCRCFFLSRIPFRFSQRLGTANTLVFNFISSFALSYLPQRNLLFAELRNFSVFLVCHCVHNFPLDLTF